MKIKTFLKKHKIMITAAAVLIVLLAVLLLRGGSGGGSVLAEETVTRRDIYTYKSFVGNAEPSVNTTVISKVSQQVMQVLVEEGEEVKKGDVIAVIDSSAVEDNIAKAEISLANGETSNSYNIRDAQRSYQNYSDALESGLNSGISSAQSALESASDALEKAKAEYESMIWQVDNGYYTATQSEYAARAAAQTAYDAVKAQTDSLQTAYEAAKQAYETGAGSVSGGDVQALLQDYQQAEAAWNAAKAELAAAEKTLGEAQSRFAVAKQNAMDTRQAAIDSAQQSYDTALKNYEIAQLSAEQQLESYQAAVDKAAGLASTDSAELELQILKDSLEDYTIYAPCDGIVTALNVSEGAMVTGGAAVAVISDLSVLQVAVSVDEYSILDTGEGSAVTVLFDAIGKSYEGMITRVADTAVLNNGVSYFNAEIDFAADEYVKSGMSAEVRLTSTDKKNVLTVSAEALYYNDDNTAYVLVKNGETQEKRSVEIGATDGSYVEILSGLEENEVVLAAPAFAGLERGGIAARINGGK